MKLLRDRIRKVLDDLASEGVDQVALGKAAGVSKGTVSQWLKGDIKSLKLEYAVGIGDAFGYDPLWLVLGRGDPKKGNGGLVAHDPTPKWPFPRIPESSVRALGQTDIASLEGIIAAGISQLRISVNVSPAPKRPEAMAERLHADLPFPMKPLVATAQPNLQRPSEDTEMPFPETERPSRISEDRDVVANVSAGVHASNDDFDPVPELADVRLAAGEEGIEVLNEAVSGSLQFRRSFLRQHDADNGRARVVYASGDSMEPVIPDGAAMLLVPAEGLTLRDVAAGGVWAINYDGKMLVKTITRPPGGMWVARSFNREYRDILLETDVDVRVIGRIVWVGATLPPTVGGQWVRG